MWQRPLNGFPLAWPQVTYTVRVQLLEIYNEALRDLLVAAPRRLEIRSTAAAGLNVPDATQARRFDNF